MYGMFPGNAVVVNFLMRFPALIPVAAVAGGLAVTTPTPKEAPVTLVPVSTPAPVIKAEETKPVNCIVYFATDRYSISASELASLNACLSTVDLAKVKGLSIDGHTDVRNGVDYNLKLSKNRAKEVAAYLTSLGYDQKSMNLQYHGLSQPADSNDSEKGMALNRRVTVNVTQ
jgi:outer membrane protein OmpA-like peptidoglycan-associated protein